MTKGFPTSCEIGAGPAIAVPNEDWETIGILKLPEGSYVVTASHYMTNNANATAIAASMLLIGDQNAQVFDIVAPDGAVSQAATVAGKLHSPGQVQLKCTNNGPTGTLEVETFSMTAIELTELTMYEREAAEGP